jgi:S1-C subfamily serine protease
MAIDLDELSAGMRRAVSRAADFTVGVDGRDGYPSTGVVYDAKRILSADHSVEREEDIQILLPDGSNQRARVAGRDPLSDLVLLELDRGTGSSVDTTEQNTGVGQLVLALGRPTEEGIQASLGILSITNGTYRAHRGASLEGVMRSDARRFPGFAGGPLIDLKGTLLGINTISSSSGTSITIPARLAWKTAEKLKSEGSIKPGYLGIRSQRVDLPQTSPLGREQAKGLLIVGIEAESPAAAAGIMVGDILVGFSGRAVSDHEDLLEQLMSGMGGKTVTVELLRGGKREEISLTVGALDGPFRGYSGRWHSRCCP